MMYQGFDDDDILSGEIGCLKVFNLAAFSVQIGCNLVL